MSKFNRDKRMASHRKFVARHIVDTDAILAGHVRFDDIPDGRICGTCQERSADARMEHYDWNPEIVARMKSSGMTSEIVATRLFEEIYQEQMDGPVHHGTEFICRTCFITFVLDYLGPNSGPPTLDALDHYGDEAGLALYRRRSRPLRLAGLVSLQKDALDVWRQKALIEQYQGAPGEFYMARPK